MNKKIVFGITVAAVIIAAITLIYFYKSGSKNQGPGESSQPSPTIVTQAQVDESVKATIEKLKTTCDDFLKGDLSGNPSSDCPGFDKTINKNLCFYCYAVKNKSLDLCEKVDADSALKTLCKVAIGNSLEEIMNK